MEKSFNEFCNWRKIISPKVDCLQLYKVQVRLIYINPPTLWKVQQHVIFP